MADQTPTLDLVKPTGGEPVEVLVLNSNMDKIDAFAAEWGRVSGRNQQFSGPANQLGSVSGMKRGDTYQATDGDFLFFAYNGAAWKNRTRAMAQLVSGTATSNGTVTPAWNGAAAGYVYQEGGKFWEAAPTGVNEDILIPYSGRYRIAYTMRTNGVAPVSVAVQKNTVDIGAQALASGSGVSGAASHAEHSFDYELAAGDKIRLRVTSTAVNSTTGIFRIEYLGEF